MDTLHLGFFVISASHVDEVERLLRRTDEVHTEECWVRANEYYRRVDELAWKRRVITTVAPYQLSLLLYEVVVKALAHEVSGYVYPPELVRTFAAKLPRVEKRRGGEDGVLARIGKREFAASPESIRDVYRGFKAMLAYAELRDDAALVKAILDDEAEARFEREQAWRRWHQQESAKRPFGPEEHARLQQEVAERIERNAEAAARGEPMYILEVIQIARLYLVSDADAEDIEQIAERGKGRFAYLGWDGPGRAEEAVRELAGERAVDTVEFEAGVDTDLMWFLECTVTTECSGAHRECGVYPAVWARLLCETLERHAAAQGEAAIVERIRKRARAKTEQAETVYRTFRATVARAADAGLALVVAFHFDDDDGAD